LSEKLAENFEKVRNFPIDVEAGKDEPTGQAHSFRFARSYVGNSQDLWLQARKNWGLAGIPPISNYETVSIGLNGLISAKVWHEIHSPSSKILSLCLLTSASLKSAWHTGEKSTEVKEIESMQELRMAVVAMDNCFRKVMWWNFSFAPIAIFLQSIEFGSNNLTGR